MSRVIAQHRQRRWVDGHQSILAELGLPNVENPSRQIGIAAIETQGFARTHAGAGEHPDDRREEHGALGVVGRYRAACGHEARELVVGEEPRWWNRPVPGERLRVERFGSRIEDREILAEPADHAVADGAAVRRGLPGEYEAEHCCPAKWPIVLLSVEIPDKLAQDSRLLGERIAERAAQREIGLDVLAEPYGECAHHAPPGNGRATSASCGTATFT